MVPTWDGDRVDHTSARAVSRAGLRLTRDRPHAMELSAWEAKAHRVDELARIGALVRQTRVESGFTQKDLSEAVGLHRVNLNKFENGRADLGVSRVRLLAEALGVDPGRLFEYRLREEPPPDPGRFKPHHRHEPQRRRHRPHHPSRLHLRQCRPSAVHHRPSRHHQLHLRPGRPTHQRRRPRDHRRPDLHLRRLRRTRRHRHRFRWQRDNEHVDSRRTLAPRRLEHRGHH